MILMRENAFRGPLEGMGPENQVFFGPWNCNERNERDYVMQDFYKIPNLQNCLATPRQNLAGEGGRWIQTSKQLPKVPFPGYF